MTQGASATTLACERLQRSRERVHRVLRANALASAAGASSLPWLEGLKRIPGFDVVLAALRAWWSEQPFHKAVMRTEARANAALQPLAQRAPLGMLAGAAVMGGLVVWLRPWRWLPASAVLGAVAPNLLGKMFTQIVTELPVQSWLAGLATFMQKPAAPPEAREPLRETSRETPLGEANAR